MFVKRNVPLLLQEVGDVVSTLFAELLIRGNAATGRGIAFHLDHVAIYGLCFVCQGRSAALYWGSTFTLPLANRTVTSS